MQKENEEQQKKAEEEWNKQRAAREAEAKKQLEEAEKAAAENKVEPEEEPEEAPAEVPAAVAQPSVEAPAETPKDPVDAQVLANAFGGLRNLLFGVQPHLPQALGFGFTPDSESFDLRALMIDSAGERSDPIPIFSGLRVGDPVTPQSPGVLPADSELVVMLSIDFPWIEEMAAALETPNMVLSGNKCGRQCCETCLAASGTREAVENHRADFEGQPQRRTPAFARIGSSSGHARE